MHSIKECYACSDVRSKAPLAIAAAGRGQPVEARLPCPTERQDQWGELHVGPFLDMDPCNRCVLVSELICEKGSWHLDKLRPIRSTTVTGIGHA